MQAKRIRVQKWCVVMSTGGLTLGIIQGFSLVNFAQIFTSLLATWLSIIVTALFGGDVSSFL